MHGDSALKLKLKLIHNQVEDFMIRVVILEIPFGIEVKQKQIAMIDVINDGSHKQRPKWGNYRVEVDGKDGKVNVVDHLRSRGLYKLLEAVFAGLRFKEIE